jgi:hypothetical protein
VNLPLQSGDDGPDIPWALALFLFPLLARIVRAVLEKLGIVQPAGTEVEAEASSERRRAAQREEEEEGADLFERLARGEAVETPAAPPPPRPVARGVSREASLESEEEPEPLSVMGESRAEPEPGCVPEPSLERAALREVSLESEEEPLPLGAFDRPPELSEAPSVPLGSRGFRLVRGDLRRAILLSEILGPPLSQRAAR